MYIDTNIRLTSNEIPALKNALKVIKDPLEIEIIQEIIETLGNKGIVGKIELEKIVNHFDTAGKIIGIHSGVIHGNGEGAAYLFRGPFQVLLFFIENALIFASYHFLGIVIFWHSLDPIRVNFQVYSQETSGFAIGYFGFLWSGGSPWNGVFYGMTGFGALIFVTQP